MGRGAGQHPYDNGFKIQWEDFIRHVVGDAPWKHDLMEGARGVQLAELASRAGPSGAGSTFRAEALDRVMRERARMEPVDKTEALRRGHRGDHLASDQDHRLQPYVTGEPIVLPKKGAVPAFNRIAYAAAHVVGDPLADVDPWLEPAVDWERTIAFRNYCGTSGSASPRRWTRRSAASASTGRAPRS